MAVTEKFWRDFCSHYGLDPGSYVEFIRNAEEIVHFVGSIIGNRNFWQVSADELSAIFTATCLLAPATVVETGVGPGSTSYAFLSALSKSGGKLYSFDLGAGYGEEKEKAPVGFLVPDHLKPNWNLTLGNSRTTLPSKLKEIKGVNIFFHDSEHTYDHVTFELNTVMPRLSGKWLIIVDNYDWTAAPFDFAERNGLSLVKVADDMCFIYR